MRCNPCRNRCVEFDKDGEKITLVNGEEKRTFDKKQISKINAEFETEIDLAEDEEKDDE